MQSHTAVCPPSTALELHAAWPEMELVVVPAAGHSMYDPGLQKGVLDATDAMRERSRAPRVAAPVAAAAPGESRLYPK